MSLLTLIHQGVLCTHLLAFAIAFSAVLREDLALLRSGHIDLPRLSATARSLTIALAVLWLSGLALLALGGSAFALATHPKAVAKLVVVTALTANGMALHTFAFPRLRGAAGGRGGFLGLPVVLGAISSASWLCASFIGVSRVVAPTMRLRDFMTVYAVLLVAAIAAALLVVAPRLSRRAGPMR